MFLSRTRVTCFVRKDFRPKDESCDERIARRILGNLRAMVMYGCFGNQKQHYRVGRIAARNRFSETMLLFFGIHTANAATLVARKSTAETTGKEKRRA